MSDRRTDPRPRWLNRTVFGIGLASLFADWSHEIATTVMPAFLATMGVAAAWLGLIEGVSDGLSSFAKMASGYYTDKLSRRKPIAILGYLVTALGTAAFGLATSAWHVLVARAFAWFGRGVRYAGAEGVAGRIGPARDLWSRVRLRANDGHTGRDRRPGHGVPAAANGRTPLPDLIRADALSWAAGRGGHCVSSEGTRARARAAYFFWRAFARAARRTTDAFSLRWGSSAQAISRTRCSSC